MRIPWDSFERETLGNLRALIRLDTSNPPGNERLAADYLSARLGEHGIKPVLRESLPGRANLVARITGSDSSKAPLMLSSHTDVVPVEAHRWTRPQFAAEVAEGCVWGRGAIDMKAKCASDLGLMTALQRAGGVLERDLIMAAVADEEAGSEHGAKFLVERHPELVRAGYVVNESGGFTVFLGERRFYIIQVAEKGYVTIRMTVTGRAGHGAVPRPDTAIARLAELILKVTRTPMPRKPTQLIRKALANLGISPETAPPLFWPMLSNTVSPTIVRAGYKDNVIPGEASVVLDGRTLPGEDPETFIAEMREIVGPEPTFELLKTAPPCESSPDTPLFRLIAERVEAADPGAHAIPWMIPGATDNKFYAQLGATCYGFAPVKLKPHMPFGSLYHANDERVPIDGFFWGLRVYADVVLTFLGLRFDDVFA
jgi:acetylornithine deacetylase/succinyl-diaminopimelate desuccinylase-like protein